MVDRRNKESFAPQYIVVIIFFPYIPCVFVWIVLFGPLKITSFSIALIFSKTESESLLPALFVNSDRKVTCRCILHAFFLYGD